MDLSVASKEFFRARDFLQQHRTDYDTAYRQYVAPELVEFNWALDVFDVQARGNRDIALWIVEEDGSGQKITYEEMSARSNRVANYLRRIGVGRGHRILLILPNRLELWDIMLAAMKLGAVVVPTTTLASAEELADRLERGRVTHVVAQACDQEKCALACSGRGGITSIAVDGEVEGWHALKESERESSRFEADGATLADDPLLLYFTSGTTSKPKLVLHSHRSYPAGHLSTMYWIGLKRHDIHWNISSPGWGKHAWSCLFAPWNAGATVFIYNYQRFNARNCLETITRCGVTSLCAPPTVWRMIIQEDLGAYKVALRELVGAGEPLNPEVIERVRAAWGLQIRDGFGQTETTAQIGNTPGQTIKQGSMGRPLPGYRIALLDADDLPSDNGEIAIQMDAGVVGIMRGYENDPQKTAEVMRGGYFHTGDVATVDADGYIFYVGRNDDVFKSSDYRISPFEIESALIEHEAVLEAAIVPSPDPLRLHVPKAFVTLRAGYSADAALARSIFAHTRDRLAPYKRVRRLEFTELPKTISGKIRRVDLRKQESLGAGSTRPAAEFREEDFSF